MIRRPPRSTLDRSSAASDVYKRQGESLSKSDRHSSARTVSRSAPAIWRICCATSSADLRTVSYTHLRAHETVLDLVCRLLLEKKIKNTKKKKKISM